MLRTYQEESRVNSVRDQVLADVPIGSGVGNVEIVAYDFDWPALYRREKIRLLAVIGSWTRSIEHIGSTAVPGLDGRPCIDVMVGVRSLADADTFCAPELQRQGYRFSESSDKLLEQRLYVKGIARQGRCTQLYVVAKDGQLWNRYLGFRNYLREHPNEAQEYVDQKRVWVAEECSHHGYTRCKLNHIAMLEASNSL
jgi:GrpB-like predicted nucleotidyltransferase (UPF0157 family)